MGQVTDFLNKYYGYAKQLEAQTKIPALVILAMSALETGWNSSKPGNMMFGVKAGSTWKGAKQLLWTNEYSTNPNLKFPVIATGYPKKVTVNGKQTYHYKVKDYFRAYATPLDSFLDYAKLLLTTRYKAAFNYTDNPVQFAAEIHKAGYATDPNYTSKIKSIIGMFLKEIELLPALKEKK